MARKRKPLDVGFWGVILTGIGLLGAGALVVFEAGKEFGAVEERVAQLERQQAALDRPALPQ